MSSQTRHTLALPPLFWIMIGVIALADAYGRWNEPPAPKPVVRYQSAQLSLDRLGLRINSDQGWTLFSRGPAESADEVTLVHPQAQLIVELDRSLSMVWPPNNTQLVIQGMLIPLRTMGKQSSELDPESTAEVLRQDFSQATVDWLVLDRQQTPGAGLRFGRLNGGQRPLRLTVVSHGRLGESEPVLDQLLRSIEWL